MALPPSLGCYPEDERGMAKDSQKRQPSANPFAHAKRPAGIVVQSNPQRACMNDPRAGFEQLLAELRPKLHRYCARMTGSIIDGEDVLQDAMAKAIEAFPHAGPIAHPEGWLFRIAHNTALDFLRRRARQENVRADQDIDMIADADSEIARRQPAAASLRTLMRLPVAQRSSVILMDVLGHSLEEIAIVLDGTVPAVKAALHRGRNRLRELAGEPDDRPGPR